MQFEGVTPSDDNVVFLNRNIFCHVQDGRITTTEFLVFCALLAMTSEVTGSTSTNSEDISQASGKQIRAYDVQRALRGLQHKGYITRVPASGTRGYFTITVNPSLGRAL